jgi:hypothetical protein
MMTDERLEEPMRCWDFEKRTAWAARKDGMCYEADEPK